jgi:hypothetical protein
MPFRVVWLVANESLRNLCTSVHKFRYAQEAIMYRTLPSQGDRFGPLRFGGQRTAHNLECLEELHQRVRRLIPRDGAPNRLETSEGTFLH